MAYLNQSNCNSNNSMLHGASSSILSDQINACLYQLEINEQEPVVITKIDTIIPTSAIQHDNMKFEVFDNQISSVSLEIFKDKLKKIIEQGSPQAHLNGANTKFESSIKGARQVAKSRQISIHTNNYLDTDCGENFSQKHETMYSTAHTLNAPSTFTGHTSQIIQEEAPHSYKQSFFNHTENSFISIDNTSNPSVAFTVAPRDDKQDSPPGLDLSQFQNLLSSNQEVLQLQKKKIQSRLVTHDREIKLRHSLKRKTKPAIQDPAAVPMNIFYTFVTYDARLFKKFLMLSRGMRKHLLFYTFDLLNPVLTKIDAAYQNYFEIQEQSLSQTPISFGNENGSRIDYTLKMRLRSGCKKFTGKSVSIINTYQLEGSSSDVLTNSYQMDIFKEKENRWLWLHHDESHFHSKADARAYTIPVMPVCVGDNLEISITLLSLMGSTEISSIEWLPLKVDKQPRLSDVRDYNRYMNLTAKRDLFQKYFADQQRVCEVEDTVVEWFDEKQVRLNSLKQHINRDLSVAQFAEQFEVQKVEIGGIDFSVWKLQLKTLKKPTKEQIFYKDLNIEIKVATSENKQMITNEVKRTGFLIDRGSRVEVRPGDTIIVYVSMGGFEK